MRNQKSNNHFNSELPVGFAPIMAFFFASIRISSDGSFGFFATIFHYKLPSIAYRRLNPT